MERRSAVPTLSNEMIDTATKQMLQEILERLSLPNRGTRRELRDRLRTELADRRARGVTPPRSTVTMVLDGFEVQESTLPVPEFAAAPSAAAPSHFLEGDHVRAKWGGSKGKQWYDGKITGVIAGGMRYDVKYDDGDSEKGLLARYVKSRHSKAPGGDGAGRDRSAEPSAGEREVMGDSVETGSAEGGATSNGGARARATPSVPQRVYVSGVISQLESECQAQEGVVVRAQSAVQAAENNLAMAIGPAAVKTAEKEAKAARATLAIDKAALRSSTEALGRRKAQLAKLDRSAEELEAAAEATKARRKEAQVARKKAIEEGEVKRSKREKVAKNDPRANPFWANARFGGRLGEGKAAPAPKRSLGEGQQASFHAWLKEARDLDPSRTDLVECELEAEGGGMETRMVTQTAKMYFESNAYKRLPKRKRVAPYDQRFAGASLEEKHGYKSLAFPSNQRNIRDASTAVPSLAAFPWIPFRTDHVLRLPGGLCCGQAAIQHATGSSLEELGLATLPGETRMIFGELAAALEEAAKRARRPLLFSLAPARQHIHDVLRSDEGVFLVHTYHLHAEDIEDVDTTSIRMARFLHGVEVIPHYVVLNMDTGVVFTYPEVLVITPAEREDPEMLLDRLKQAPYQLLFDTSSLSQTNNRRLMLRVHPDALGTSYNSPALLRELLKLEQLRHWTKAEREAWRSRRNTQDVVSEIEIEGDAAMR